MAVSARRCHFSLTSFSVSLLCVSWFWVLCLFQSRYVHFTRVRKFHDSLTLNDFFSLNHITNFCNGCPMWLFKVLLPSLVFICTSPVSLDSLILPATPAVKTCFTCKKKNQNLGSSVRASRPFYFLQFQSLTFKHCSSFCCPNTFLFDLPSSFFITEDTVRFQNRFLEN